MKSKKKKKIVKCQDIPDYTIEMASDDYAEHRKNDNLTFQEIFTLGAKWADHEIKMTDDITPLVKRLKFLEEVIEEIEHSISETIRNVLRDNDPNSVDSDDIRYRKFLDQAP